MLLLWRKIVDLKDILILVLSTYNVDVSQKLRTLIYYIVDLGLAFFTYNYYKLKKKTSTNTGRLK